MQGVLIMLGEELRQTYLAQKEKILTREFATLKTNVEELCRKSAMNGDNVLKLSTHKTSRMAVDKLIEFLKTEGLDVDYKEDKDLMYIKWDLDE